jgi:FkbM family methyltransferase
MTNMILQSLGRQIISWLPAKCALAKGGATLSPSLRTALTARFLSAVAARCACLPADLDTNLGIDQRLRVKISTSKSALLFGAPHLFIGERSSLDLAATLVKYADCFIDVGANIGLYIFYLRCRDGYLKPIYFFEADPDLFSGLKENISRNGLLNVEGFQVAVAEKVGKAIFFQNRTDDSSGTLIKEDWSKHLLQPIEVDKTSFATFVNERQLKNVCAKVDVEGAEELFFDGARSSLDKLKFLIIEILGPAIGRNFPAKLIREANFHAYYINDYRLEHSPLGDFTYAAPFYNWLFCRESPASLRDKLIGTRFQVIASNQSLKSHRSFNCGYCFGASLSS